MFLENPFVKEPRIVTGIDLGASAIKVATVLQTEQGRPEIVRLSSHPLTRPDRLGDDAQARARLVEALRRAKAAHEVPMGTVVVGLPRDRVTVRYVTLPSKVPEEVEEMLMFDIERHVPFPIEEMQTDFVIVEQSEENSSTVMLVATPLEEVKAWVDLFAQAGIEVGVVDVGILAACASYGMDRQDTTQVRAIVDLGRSKCDLGVIVGDTVRFSHSLSLGEDRLQELSGAEPSELRPPVLHPGWVSELTAGLRRQLKAYECTPDSQEVKEVVLCGGLSRLHGLEHALAAQLNRRVKASSPELEGIAGVNGSLDPELAVALGLALRSLDKPKINLLPRPIVEARVAARQQRFLRNVGLYAAVIFVLIAGIVGEKFQAKWAHRARLLQALQQIEPKIKDIKQKKAELADIQVNVDVNNSFYKVLTDLYTRTPVNVMYQEIKFEKKKQLDLLRGRTPTQEEIFNLVNILKESPHFRDVILSNTRSASMYKVLVREFDITCILKSNQEYRPKRVRGAAREGK